MGHLLQDTPELHAFSLCAAVRIYQKEIAVLPLLYDLAFSIFRYDFTRHIHDQEAYEHSLGI